MEFKLIQLKKHRLRQISGLVGFCSCKLGQFLAPANFWCKQHVEEIVFAIGRR